MVSFSQEVKLGLPVGHAWGLNNAQFSPDGRLIVTVGDDLTARLWDLHAGKLLHTLEGHSFSIASVQFSPDSELVVTASSDNTAKLWDVNS